MQEACIGFCDHIWIIYEMMDCKVYTVLLLFPICSSVFRCLIEHGKVSQICPITLLVSVCGGGVVVWMILTILELLLDAIMDARAGNGHSRLMLQ